MLLSTSVACLFPFPLLLYQLSLSSLSTPTCLYIAKPISNQEKLHLRERRHLWSTIKKVALHQPTVVMLQPIWWALELILLTDQSGMLQQSMPKLHLQISYLKLVTHFAIGRALKLNTNLVSETHNM